MKKIMKILFWVGLIVAVASIVLARPIQNMDEIWNFNMARCIAGGLVPYRDISMIVTPLFAFIEAIFLKIFGSEIIVARFLAIALMGINSIFTLKIFKELKVREELSYLFLLGITFLLKDHIYMDYNFLLVTFALIILYLELKYKGKRSKRLQLCMGILGGLCICTKQTIGALICAVLLLNRFFFVKEKKDLKVERVTMLYRFIGILIPIAIFVTYMLITKSFGDFWDYCVSGIKTFENRIQYKKLFKSNPFVVVYSIIIPVVLVENIIATVVCKIKKKDVNSIFTVLVYSLPVMVMVYPIADETHLTIGSTLTLILLGYNISLLLELILKKLKHNTLMFVTQFTGAVAVLATVLFAANFEVKHTETLSDLSKYKNIKHYKYAYIDNNERDLLKEVNGYVEKQEKKVYILDSCSAFFMIPMDRYNKDYDSFMVGNFGSRGEDKIIEKIKNEDAQYLILSDDYSLNWQNPVKVRQYIKENMEYKGTAGIYYVYENKLAETEENTEEVVENQE